MSQQKDMKITVLNHTKVIFFFIEQSFFHTLYSDHAFSSHNFFQILCTSTPTKLHTLYFCLQKTKADK